MLTSNLMPIRGADVKPMQTTKVKKYIPHNKADFWWLLVVAVTNFPKHDFNRCKSTTCKFLSRDTKSARDKNGTKPRKNKAFYVIVGLSARIVYRQAPLANIEIKNRI